MRTFPCLLPTLLFATMCCAPRPAGAAESYDSCTGYIDSLPAVIGTQGTWCLRKDLSTAMTSGSAIIIATNNVTIDCNDFKIGGLAAGNASRTVGIEANGRQNTTIRNCNLRGFYSGIHLEDGGGDLIEDNRLDKMLVYGINAAANTTIRRNRVFDTGGYSGGASDFQGIRAGHGVVADNTVVGVLLASASATSCGIYVGQPGSVARSNTVRVSAGVVGICLSGSTGIRIERNDLTGSGVATGILSVHASNRPVFCGHNTISGFQQAMTTNCIDTGGNVAF